MIRVKGITKSFGDEQVLKGVDVELFPGKCNLIIGLSGSGKTVFLKSILGLHTIDSGIVEYDDRIWDNLNKNDRKKLRQEMGMVFQGSALFNSLSIEENVGLPLNFFSGMTDSEKVDRIKFCLNRVFTRNDMSYYQKQQISSSMHSPKAGEIGEQNKVPNLSAVE